jgi:phosphoglycolate phosphatase
MKYRNIIFDLDGTLLNTIEDLTDGVNHVMEMYGYNTYSISQIKSFVGNGIMKLMETAVPNGKENEKFDEMYNEFKSYYTNHCRIKTRPYDDILNLLGLLKEQDYGLAIVSNKNDGAVKELAEYFFDDYINIAIGQSETTRKKPAPDTVYEAMKELPKGACLYVGDSEVDKMTADNAGTDCVLVSWGFRDKAMLESLKPLSVIDSPKELIAIVQ